MDLLIDTHILLWWQWGDRKLPQKARRLIEAEHNEIYFSSVSIAETSVKKIRHKKFDADPRVIRESALGEFKEIPFRGTHALEIEYLPLLHLDSFDRMLLAQAKAEGFNFLTADAQLEDYGKWVILV